MHYGPPMFFVKFVLSAFLLIASQTAVAEPLGNPSAGLRHLIFKFGGLFLLDYDRSEHLINQTDGGDSIVLDDYRNGFRLIQNETKALGIDIAFNFAIPTNVPVGLDLLAGTNVSFDRFAPTRDAASKMQKPRLPSRAPDLTDWSEGDNVLFLARGGVGFSVGADWNHVAGPAAYFFAEGDWYVYIEKYSPNHAYVKVTNSQILSLGVVGNSVVAGLGIEAFKEADQGFSFRYDLNDPTAAKAYEDAIRGNFEPSEKFADAGTFVSRAATNQTAWLGLVRYWYFGVPFLASINGNTGQIHSRTSVLNHENGNRSTIYSGLYVDHLRTGGWLSKHAMSINNFIGSRYIEKGPNGQISSGYLGQYLWAWESSKGSYRKIHKHLAALVAKTGLESLLSINIPEENKLGYLNMQFQANLPQETVDLLMEWATGFQETGADLLMQSSQKGMETYFSAGQDSLGICEASVQDIGECKARMVRETRRATRKLMLQLKAMAVTKNTDFPAFVRHFGEFGKQMATNRFTFSQILELTQKAPLEMTFSMGGERISILRKVITRSQNQLLQ